MVAKCKLPENKNPLQLRVFCDSPTGQFSNHLLERFRKMYELKLKAVIVVELLEPAVLPKRMKVA